MSASRSGASAIPGTSGTLIRTADAFGPRSWRSPSGCADPTGPKALRASAGAIFRVPLGAFDDAPGRRVALVAHGGEPLSESTRAGDGHVRARRRARGPAGGCRWRACDARAIDPARARRRVAERRGAPARSRSTSGAAAAWLDSAAVARIAGVWTSPGRKSGRSGRARARARRSRATGSRAARTRTRRSARCCSSRSTTSTRRRRARRDPREPDRRGHGRRAVAGRPAGPRRRGRCSRSRWSATRATGWTSCATASARELEGKRGMLRRVVESGEVAVGDDGRAASNARPSRRAIQTVSSPPAYGRWSNQP